MLFSRPRKLFFFIFNEVFFKENKILRIVLVIYSKFQKSKNFPPSRKVSISFRINARINDIFLVLDKWLLFKTELYQAVVMLKLAVSKIVHYMDICLHSNDQFLLFLLINNSTSLQGYCLLPMTTTDIKFGSIFLRKLIIISKNLV